MKKLLFVWLLFMGALYALTVNEYLNDVYFANGINTDEKTAKKSRDILKKEFYAYNSGAAKKIGEWKVSYNHTHGIGIDLYESFLQKIYEAEPGTSLAPFIWNMDEIADYFVFSFRGIVRKIAEKAPKALIKAYAAKAAKNLARKAVKKYYKIHGKKLTEKQLEAMFNNVFDYLIEKGTEKYLAMSEEEIMKQENEDVAKQETAYIRSIAQRHGVIIVAHSQGNLFTNRVYEDLKFGNITNGFAWMRQFITAIGVASPADNILGKKIPYLTFDNDMIKLVPNSLPPNVHNPVRYHIINAVGEDIGETLYSVKAHSFLDSYMAEDITKNAILGFIEGAIAEHDSRASQWGIKKRQGCMCLDKTVSVYHKYNKLPNYYALDRPGLRDILHIFTDIPKYKIKDFSGSFNTKIYSVGKDYVRASEGGEQIESQNERDVCLKLIGSGKTVGEIRGPRRAAVPQIHNGAVNMYLNWDHECSIDMNLIMKASEDSKGGPYIMQDIKDVPGYGEEHTYIDSKYHIFPGDRYFFFANGRQVPGSEGDETDLDANPAEIRALLTTPGGSYFKTWKAFSYGQLNIGKFAELAIEKGKAAPKWICPALNNVPDWYNLYNEDTKKFQCINCEKPYKIVWDKPDKKKPGRWVCNKPKPDFNTTVEPVRVYNRCAEKTEEEKSSCGCVPCRYIVSGMKRRVENGPVAGADVKIVKASDWDKSFPKILWKGKTTDSDDIFESGMINIPGSKLAEFDEDTYYIVTVEGGSDIDYNDDMKRDLEPVKNNGVIHAVIKGEDLKKLPFRVNILTEAVYQVMGGYIGDRYSREKLEKNLDDAAKRLLSKKLYPKDIYSGIDYKDVLLWTPGADKKALYKPFDIYVKPIIDKLYAGKDRYALSYRLIYGDYDSSAPQLAPESIKIPAGLANGTVVAVLSPKNGKPFSSIEFQGNYADYFKINSKGYLLINKTDLIHSGDRYRLQARAVGIDGKKGAFASLDISVLSDGADYAGAPVFVSADVNSLYENPKEGTIAAKVYFKDKNHTIVSYRISGKNSSSFEADKNGVIRVAKNADIDYEKSKLYTIKATAVNDAGKESWPVKISIPVKNRIDTPLFELEVFKNIKENTPAGTKIAVIKKVRDGAAPVESFDILNPHIPFEIDNNGTIRVSGLVDYEQKKSYLFYAVAKTKYGNSNKIEINFLVDNQDPETGIPLLKDITVSVDENISPESKIGQLELNTGASKINRFALYGRNHDMFRIDANGTVYLAEGEKLDYEKEKRYDLGVRALNSRGWSNEAHILIKVNNVPDTVPEIKNLTASAEESKEYKTGYIFGHIGIIAAGEGNITGFKIKGEDSALFKIDKNGSLSLKEDTVFDYENRKEYRFFAYAYNSSGESSPALVKISVKDIPDTPPVLKDVSFAADENISAGTLIGTAKIISEGDTPITSFELDDNSTFEIDNKGSIYLKTPLDYEKQSEYNLHIRAFNAAGAGNTVAANISIMKIYYTGDSQANDFTGTQRSEKFDMKDGNDTVHAGAGDDIITGDRGNDILYGGSGNDTYIYNLGDGNDTINDSSGDDKLILHNISKDKISFVLNGADLQINILEDNSTVRIAGWKDNSRKIEHIVFDDSPQITLDSFNIPIVAPDAGIVDLSKLRNSQAAQVAEGRIVPLGDGKNSVDHWNFHYDGGTLEIDLLSELASNGHSYIDIDRDGNQTGVDVYIYLFKKDSDGKWKMTASNDDSSYGTADGSSHQYDSYLKIDLEEGDYMLSVGNYPLYYSEALTDSNAANSYPKGGPYQITFNKALEFSSIPANAEDNLYGSDHYNFYVLRNDLDPYNMDGLRIYSPVMADENGTPDDSLGRAEVNGNYISYYPEDNFKDINGSKEINIIYDVLNKNNIPVKSLLTLKIVPSMYTHSEVKVNNKLWKDISADNTVTDLNITRQK